MVSDIQWNKAKKQCTGACMVDFEKAFDTVWLKGLIYKLITLGLPKHLLYVTYNMISDKKFVVKCGDTLSNKEFLVINGLQQGAVNSPLLFNIYTSDLLGSLNNAIAYADDIVVYRSLKKIRLINESLQDDINLIKEYCANWKLKINFQKTETILFRTAVSKATRDTRRNWKKFCVNGENDQPLTKKSEVRYLGIWLDQFLHFNKHITCALSGAKKAYSIAKPLFRSKYLDPNVKILCYSAIVRPILAYGCPVWFNISPSYMEKFRVFERQCLRSCLGLYRTPESEYKKFVPNVILYNESKLNRIDNFLIKIIRGHIARALYSDNNLISGAFYPNDRYLESTLSTGFIPPEAFIFLDHRGLILSNDGIPLLYHVSRGAWDKRILHTRNSLYSTRNLRFNMSVGERDKFNKDGIKANWWWLLH